MLSQVQDRALVKLHPVLAFLLSKPAQVSLWDVSLFWMPPAFSLINLVRLLSMLFSTSFLKMFPGGPICARLPALVKTTDHPPLSVAHDLNSYPLHWPPILSVACPFAYMKTVGKATCLDFHTSGRYKHMWLLSETKIPLQFFFFFKLQAVLSQFSIAEEHLWHWTFTFFKFDNGYLFRIVCCFLF